MKKISSTTTIHRRQKGDKGDPGTGIAIKCSALKYYDSYVDYETDTAKDSGIYLVDGMRDPFVPTRSKRGAYVYTYDSSGQSTVPIVSASEGDSYTSLDDGHMYTATSRTGTTATSSEDLTWTDCGVVRGENAVTYALTVPLSIPEGTRSVYLSVVKTDGETQSELTFAQCTAEGIYVTGQSVVWGERFQQMNFGKGAVRGTTYTATLKHNDVTIAQYNVVCVGNGSTGYDGCIVRRSEWQPDKQYRNDRSLTPVECLATYGDSTRYIDEVCVTDLTTGIAVWKLCRTTHMSLVSSAAEDDTHKHWENTDVWEAMNSLAPVRTSFADIAQAFIDYLQVNQILLTDGTNTYGAFGKNSSGYPLWFGGTSPANAVTKFKEDGSAELASGNLMYDASGKLKGKNFEFESGSFSGYVKRVPTYITADNWQQYMKLENGMYEIDFFKAGTFIIIDDGFYASGSADAIIHLPSALNAQMALENGIVQYIGNDIIIYNITAVSIIRVHYYGSNSYQYETILAGNARRFVCYIAIPTTPAAHNGFTVKWTAVL